MHTYVMTAALSAAALTLSLALAAPALARSGDHAQQRKFHRTDGRQIHFCDLEANRLRTAGLAHSSTWAIRKPWKPSG